MSYTIVTRIVSNNDKIYADINEWKEDHGECGSGWFDLLDGSLVLEEGGKSVLRTLVYINEESREAHVEYMESVARDIDSHVSEDLAVEDDQ